MAYNKRNLLVKILEIQELVAVEYAKGISYTVIYRRYIRDKYYISYSTFNNYLSRNAKKELAELDVQRQDSQMELF